MGGIGFDLDGVLYWTKPTSFTALNKSLEHCGYPKISNELYTKNFNSRDWEATYLSWGVQKDDVKRVGDQFWIEFDKLDLPPLVPGGKETITKAGDLIGQQHLYFITNERLDRVHGRFLRDSIDYLPGNIKSVESCKGNTLYEIAVAYYPNPFLYIADTVADGNAVEYAREKGAINLFFGGITHEYILEEPKRFTHYLKKGKHNFEILNLKLIIDAWHEILRRHEK